MADDAFHLIAKAQAAYARTIDDDRLEDWPGYFAEPSSYVITTAANVKDGLEGGLVFCSSHGMLKDRISALREANVFERHAYRHILGAPHIAAQRGNEVDSETPFMVARIMRTGDTDLFVTGKYVDTYVVEGGKALIRSRRVICDSTRIDTLLVIPL